MKASTIKKLHYLAIAVVFSLLSLFFAFFHFKQSEEKKTQTSLVLDSYRDNIVLNLQKTFNYTDQLTFAMLMESDATHFDTAAKRMIEQPACTSVELVKGRNLAYVYPADADYTKMIGADISELNYAYTLAKLTGKLTVEGPVDHYGKQVFLVIRPLFEKNSEGTDVFWGEAVITLDSQTVLNSFNLDSLVQSGYDYELWSVHPMDGSKQTIARSSETADLSEAVETKFELPTVWTLSIVPSDGWHPLRALLPLILFTLLVTACFALILYFYRQKKVLEYTLASSSKRDPETGFLIYESLRHELDGWVTNQSEPFSLFYLVLTNYVNITRLCTPEQKTELLEHVISCLDQYISEQHIVARVGESDYIIALKDSSNIKEIENIKKGLVIELIKKVTLDNRKAYLQADCVCCQYPDHDATLDELVQSMIRQYHGREGEGL